MDYFLGNWGSFVGVLSLIITIIGFVIAIRRATQARTAAQAAEMASRQVREAIGQRLTATDLTRAIQLIQRIKDFHRDQRWEVSLQHYQILRSTLADILGRLSETMFEAKPQIQSAVRQVSAIENSVDRAVREGIEPAGQDGFNPTLTNLQSTLEGIEVQSQFGSSEGRD